MLHDTTIFILACAGILGIKSPVDIRMRTKDSSKRTGQLAGFAETRMRKGKIVRHVIFVNLKVCAESEYNLADVIAHELVHSLMLETNTFDDNHHHDIRFQKLCELLEAELYDQGMPVGKLYNPETDTD